MRKEKTTKKASKKNNENKKNARSGVGCESEAEYDVQNKKNGKPKEKANKSRKNSIVKFIPSQRRMMPLILIPMLLPMMIKNRVLDLDLQLDQPPVIALFKFPNKPEIQCKFYYKPKIQRRIPFNNDQIGNCLQRKNRLSCRRPSFWNSSSSSRIQ